MVVQPGLCLAWSETPKKGFIKDAHNTEVYIMPTESWKIQDNPTRICRHDKHQVGGIQNTELSIESSAAIENVVSNGF